MLEVRGERSPLAPATRPRGVGFAGVAHAVPERVMTNAPIARRLGVDEHWIERRTGTRERHVKADRERLSELAAEAGRAALAPAGAEAGELDLVVVATTSSDELSPHAAPLVAGALGADAAGAVDIGAACTGFLSALAFAGAGIEAGRLRRALVIGADALTQFLDPDDRQSAMLFGDGAGAVVLEAIEAPSHLGPVLMRSDAGGSGLISLRRDEQLIRMDGPAVYSEAVARLTAVSREAAEAAGVALDDIDLFVYHQANSRILEAVARRLDLDPSRTIDCVGRFANTSAASLPIALSVAAEEDRLHPGDRLLLAAFGAGFVWAGAVVEWG